MQHAAEWVFECCNIIAIMLLCYIRTMHGSVFNRYVHSYKHDHTD